MREPLPGGRRFTVAFTVAVVVLLCVTVAFGLFVRARYVEQCHRVGAEWVPTGRGNGICVTPDGRVVKP